MKGISILVAEDDPSARLLVVNYLESQGYDVVEAETCAEAEQTLAASRPHAAVLDYRLPDGDALGLLDLLHRADPAPGAEGLSATPRLAEAV